MDTQNLAIQLAYARKSLLLNPSDQEAILKVQSLRKELSKAPQVLYSSSSQHSSTEMIAPQHWIPLHIVDLTLCLFVFLTTLYLLVQYLRKLPYSKVVTCGLLPLLMIVSLSRFAHTYDRLGNIERIHSYQDIFKSEAVILKNVNAHASPQLESQLVEVLEAGSEIDVYTTDSDAQTTLDEGTSWIRIRTPSGRYAWITADEETVYTLR